MSEDNELRVLDLVYVSIKGWRLILVLACIVGLLSGVYCVYKNQNITFSDTQITDRQTALSSSNTEIIDLQRNIAESKVIVDNKKDYLKNSILMQVDPQAKQVAKLVIAIKPMSSSTLSTDEQDMAISGLTQIYLQIAKGDQLYAYIDQYGKMALDKKYSDDQIKEYLSELIVIKPLTSNTFSIETTYLDSDNSIQLGYAVLGYIQAYSLRELQVLQPHTIEIMDATNTVTKDTELEIYRQKLKDSIPTLESQILGNKDTIKSIATASLDSDSKSSLAKQVILGIIVGIMISIAYNMSRFILGTRLESAEKTQQKFGIFVIGIITSASKSIINIDSKGR